MTTGWGKKEARTQMGSEIYNWFHVKNTRLGVTVALFDLPNEMRPVVPVSIFCRMWFIVTVEDF